MDSLSAFRMGELHRNDEPMVFDWDKAARLIKESGCDNASAGLRDDWEWTGGSIYYDGEPDMEDYTYLASTWAVPELMIRGQIYPCYKMQHEVPKWGPLTKWPESALKILKEAV